LLERQATQPALKLVLQDVRDQVADGMALADALRRHPKVFTELAVSMVRAGEEGSFLEDVLKRVADFTEHQEDLKSRLIGSVAYPAFLLVIGSLIVTTMIVWFVPKFEPIFARMERRGQLPWATTALMTLSHNLGRYGTYFLIVLAVGLIFLYRYAQTEQGKYVLDGLKLKLQGAGAIVRSLAIARFCRILGTLLQNGVPILQSIRIAKDATGNRVLSRAIAEAADNVQAGKSLAKPLAASRQFPEDVVEMIAVGEEANNLEQVLIDISENMERRTYRQLDLFVRLLEPVMLMVMAGVILFVVAGLLLPILQSSSIL
ncbi:MAG TPA: type II secretion system F family protein, partial [Planctomycetaceae bacterium]|nr:type II secretion system F family protein [Planctomycetaceae bacterium]